MKSFPTIRMLLALSCIVVFFSCNNSEAAKAEINAIPSGEITVVDFEKIISADSNAQIIDVRTPVEFESGHLNNAVNVDWKSNDFESKISAFKHENAILVYCKSGNRSREAAAKMRQMGFKKVYELKGGILAWNESDKVTVSNAANIPAKSMSVEAFNKKITSDKLVLVDFNAPWCGPCKRLSPILDEVSKEQKDFMELVKINTDDNTELASALNIENLPTLILYKNGKEVWKNVGFLDKIGVMIAIENAKK